MGVGTPALGDGMIYALVGAVVIGIALGLLGSGGSILTVPILVYLLHHEDKAAIAESLAIVGLISLVGAARARIAGHLDLRSAFLFGLPGMGGTLLGAYIANWVPGAFQLVLLACIMLAAAAMMFLLRKVEPRTRPPAAVLVMAQGAAVGLITGLVGVGGGFLIVPALVLLLGLPMATAVATSLAIITLNAAVGFVKYQMVLDTQGLAVHWPTIAIFGILGIAGSLAGSAAAVRIDAGLLRRIFAIFLVVMAGYILYREIPRLATPPTGSETALILPQHGNPAPGAGL